nr:hypothetical protein [Tanacetum cinerariifolium]
MMKVVVLEFVRRKAKRTGRIVFHGSESVAWSRSPAQLSEDAQLYLDAFKKYFECCGGTSHRESTIIFKGTMLVAGSCHTNAGKRNVIPKTLIHFTIISNTNKLETRAENNKRGRLVLSLVLVFACL